MPARAFAAFAALTVPAVLLASVATAQEPPPAPAQAQPAPAPQTPPAQTPPAQTPAPAPPPDAKAILESACTSCHGLDFITEHRKTRDGWDFTVHTMIDRGAALSPEETTLVIDYLAKTYPADAKPADPNPAPKPPA